MGEKVRINKYLASLGIASRRKIDQMISSGLIFINGEKLLSPGIKVNPDTDKITVSGQVILPTKTPKYYFLLNKPVKVLSSVTDDRGRQTVLDLIDSPDRLYPVGRLDYDTSGLIILTNDGDFTLHLTHPRYHLPKTYLVRVKGEWNSSLQSTIERGVLLEDGLTSPSKVKLKSRRLDVTDFWITIHEGKNRQIRRMCQQLGLFVLSLSRVAIGPIQLGNLTPGQYRPLTSKEIATLKNLSRGQETK